MADIIIPLGYHGATRMAGAVEVGPDEALNVVVTFRDETTDDRAADRTFAPDEARALAAALVHFADEAEA